jgi:hypothetical protein
MKKIMKPLPNGRKMRPEIEIAKERDADAVNRANENLRKIKHNLSVLDKICFKSQKAA